MSDLLEPSRRNFLAVAAAATCFSRCRVRWRGWLEARKVTMMMSRTKGPPPVPEGKTDAGPVAGYAKDGVTDKWSVSNHFLVVRDGNKLYALSSVCSHKAAILKLDAKNIIHCPKHNSLYDNKGVPTKGPATKSGPLTRFAVAIDAKGHLIVDNTDRFTEDDWAKKGAFVAIK